MNRHRERFDNFFSMCTQFYKFDLFRAFIEEVRTDTNHAIEFDAKFGTSTIHEVFNRGIDSLREHLNWDTIKDYISIPYIPSHYECLMSYDIYNEHHWPFGPIDDLIDDFMADIIDRTYTQLDFETNDSLPPKFEAFRTRIRNILLTIYHEELGTDNPYTDYYMDSVSIAFGTDEGDSISSSRNHVHIDMDELL